MIADDKSETPVKGVGKHVRLELPPETYERLARCAASLGLSLAAYARMSLIKQLKAEETSGTAVRA